MREAFTSDINRTVGRNKTMVSVLGLLDLFISIHLYIVMAQAAVFKIPTCFVHLPIRPGGRCSSASPWRGHGPELMPGSTSRSPRFATPCCIARAGLVVERRGPERLLPRRPAGLRPVINWLDRYQAFWSDRIERLKGPLKEMDK